ncbi:uncharacterized protein LOC122669694 [Telopea speciosissima]|uniref:uncharacterized protein LOC122669694 n=1 Tax=Telopea speciosissima TaxID=54955 RepID=UPI001CC5298D|nr:uncharacterized protein LOC122669694 [Telopea speciosissima]
MMGFGSFNHGSSSLSSNLSPLAQPFAVDRSLPKPNLNPPVPFAEGSYSSSLRPPFENWLHLHPPTSVSHPFSNPSSISELDSTHATNVSCSGNYGYYGSQSISSFDPHLQPNAATSSIGSFPYDLRQSESIRTTLVAAKPYYPQYPSSASHDDSNLVVLNDCGCNTLSASSFAPLNETNDTGYSRSFSVGYTGHWTDFCDGLADEEQARRKGRDGNLFCNGYHGTNPMTDKSFLNQGTPAPEGLPAKRVEISAIKSPSGSRVSYASVTSSSSSLVFGARAGETSFSALETSRNVNFSQQPGDAFDNGESAACFTSNFKEPLIQMSSKDLLKAKPKLQANYFKLSDACNNVVSGGAGTADSAEGSSETFDQFNPVVDSPCWKGAPTSRLFPFGVTEVVYPYLPVKEFEGCNSSSIEGPHILAVNADDAVAFSLKKEGVNLVPDENEHGEAGSSSLSKGFSSVNFLSVEDELKDSVKAAPYYSKLNIENEILCSDGIQELTQPRKEHVPSICSKSSELKPSHMKQMSYGNNITSELFTSEETVVNSESDIKDLGQDGSSCVQSNVVEQSSSLPFSLASVPVGLAKQFGEASDTGPKIDIQLLLNAMHNLSELLLSSCSSDLKELKEQDHEVIRRVINNLDACLSKKVGLMRSMPQIQFPESSTCCLEIPTDPQKVSWTCRSQVNSVEAVNVPSQNDLEGKMHCTDSGKQDMKLQDVVSMDGETGIKIDQVIICRL